MGAMMSIECSSWPRTSAATTTRSIPARASGSRMAGCLRLRANRRTPLTFGPQAAQARRVHSAWSHRWRVVLLSLVWTFAFVLVDSRILDAAAQPAVSTPPIVPIDVRLHERVVFTLRTGRAGHTVQERSRAASAALESVLDDPSQGGARIEEQPGTAVVFVGRTPIVTLGDDDAAAAGGEITLHVYAASVASKIDDTLRAERNRSAIADHVFSLSLLVFSALLPFLLLRPSSSLV